MKQVMNERFENLNDRFKRLELWLKILAGLSLIGIIFSITGFIELIKRFSRYLEFQHGKIFANTAAGN